MSASGIKTSDLPLYWQSVVNTMAEGLFIVDTSGKVVFINPAAERITGYTSDEVVGQPCSILESETCLACQEDGGRHTCRLFEQGRVENRRCVIKTKGGRAVHLLKNASVLHDEHGRVVGGVETITDVSELVQKDRQISGLRRELKREFGFEGIIGETPVMLELFELLSAAAASDAPVVILGESGTGKELAAGAIHRRSPRSNGPFVRVNCAALNESLLESELFGHEKGSFTGADRTRKGRFEAASGGSLFLDEIGDLPAAVQVKLLRVLQEGEVERVGSNTPIKVDVRIITATNQDLQRLMQEGRFRQDLFYRINVVPIHMPPLRQRVEDIWLLVQNFVERLALRSGRAITGVSPPALKLLGEYAWPGNVRELFNAMEFAFVSCRQGLIGPEHLPPAISGPVPPQLPAAAGGKETDMRRKIEQALLATGGHKARAAQMLGVSRVTLWKRMKKLGMSD